MILKKHSKFSGFTLIELTVVMVIIGLIIAGISNLLYNYIVKQKLDEQNETFHKLKTLLFAFSAKTPIRQML